MTVFIIFPTRLQRTGPQPVSLLTGLPSLLLLLGMGVSLLLPGEGLPGIRLVALPHVK